MNAATDTVRPAALPSSALRRLVLGLGRRTTGWVCGGLSGLLGSRAGSRFGILTYHRVAPRSMHAPQPTWNVTPRRFRAQLRGLVARGYHPLPLRDILHLNSIGARAPRQSFAVTFDDGYENVYTHAWPILRELGVPATVFLSTAYLDQTGPFPFDDWSAAGSRHVPADSWRPLTSARCAEMADDGLVELGSHTHTHAVFRGRPEEFRRDVTSSLEVLHSRFGLADATFSFPFGIADDDLTAAARRTGLICGLTTQNDLVRPGSDPFTWGRFAAEETDTAATLAAKLDGWYSLARGAWLKWRNVPQAETA